MNIFFYYFSYLFMTIKTSETVKSNDENAHKAQFNEIKSSNIKNLLKRKHNEDSEYFKDINKKYITETDEDKKIASFNDEKWNLVINIMKIMILKH